MDWRFQKVPKLDSWALYEYRDALTCTNPPMGYLAYFGYRMVDMVDRCEAVGEPDALGWQEYWRGPNFVCWLRVKKATPSFLNDDGVEAIIYWLSTGLHDRDRTFVLATMATRHVGDYCANYPRPIDMLLDAVKCGNVSAQKAKDLTAAMSGSNGIEYINWSAFDEMIDSYNAN